MIENPNADVEDAISHLRSLLDEHQRKFLELVKSDSYNDMPQELKELHLSCLKTFQMYYNSTNAFDSQTALLQIINKAIYEPLAAESSLYSREHETSRRSQLQEYGSVAKVESPRREVNNGSVSKLKGLPVQAKAARGLSSGKKILSCTPPVSHLTSAGMPRARFVPTLWF